MQHPVRMEEVWDVRYKSLFSEHVKVFKLYPEDTENYECIGYVARQIKRDGTLEHKFDFNKYACLHKRYLTPAEHDSLGWPRYSLTSIFETQLLKILKICYAPSKFSKKNDADP